MLALKKEILVLLNRQEGKANYLRQTEKTLALKKEILVLLQQAKKKAVIGYNIDFYASEILKTPLSWKQNKWYFTNFIKLDSTHSSEHCCLCPPDFQ